MPGEYNIRQMQEEAVRRAREMQSRARIPRSPRPEEPTPHAPEQPSLEHSAPKSEPAQIPHERRPGLLENLLQDQERTLILALLILLSGEENSSHELLFALMFLLL